MESQSIAKDIQDKTSTENSCDALIKACESLLESAEPKGHSQTDNKKQYLGKFIVYGHTLEKIASIINCK